MFSALLMVTPLLPRPIYRGGAFFVSGLPTGRCRLLLRAERMLARALVGPGDDFVVAYGEANALHALRCGGRLGRSINS